MSNMRDLMNEQAKQSYASKLSGNENGKGVHMYKTPFLWDENNPVDPVVDTPTENFIPTPSIHDGGDAAGSKIRRFVKFALIGLFVAFILYCLVMMIVESPEIFRFQPINW